MVCALSDVSVEVDVIVLGEGLYLRLPVGTASVAVARDGGVAQAVLGTH